MQTYGRLLYFKYKDKTKYLVKQKCTTFEIFAKPRVWLYFINDLDSTFS